MLGACCWRCLRSMWRRSHRLPGCGVLSIGTIWPGNNHPKPRSRSACFAASIFACFQSKTRPTDSTTSSVAVLLITGLHRAQLVVRQHVGAEDQPEVPTILELQPGNLKEPDHEGLGIGADAMVDDSEARDLKLQLRCRETVVWPPLMMHVIQDGVVG